MRGTGKSSGVGVRVQITERLDHIENRIVNTPCSVTLRSVDRTAQSDVALPSLQVAELKRFPIDRLEGIITRSDVQIDKQISIDGRGSL